MCADTAGPGPCMNPAPHDPPKNCVHHGSPGDAEEGYSE